MQSQFKAGLKKKNISQVVFKYKFAMSYLSVKCTSTSLGGVTFHGL